MFSIGSRSQGKPVLLADIESGSVAVAIAAVPTTGAAHIITSERASLPIESQAQGQSGSAIATLLSDVLGRVMKKYSEDEVGKKMGPVNAVHCVVGAPWVHSRTAKAERTFPQPQQITDALIKELAKEALQKQTEQKSGESFETNVSRVELNGYPTAKPAGKQAKNVTVTVFQSDIEPDMRAGLERSLGAVAPGRPINLRSRTRALLTVLHEHNDVQHCTIIAMGSDVTECVAVHKEELTEQATIPEGTSTLLRRAAGPNGLPEESLSLMRMLVADTCATPACEELKTSIVKVEPELSKTFGETFSKVVTSRRLPNKCYMSVHADVVPWLEHFLTKIDFSPFTVTMQPFEVEALTPDHVRELVSWQVGNREDTGIAIAAAFAHITTAS